MRVWSAKYTELAKFTCFYESKNWIWSWPLAFDAVEGAPIEGVRLGMLHVVAEPQGEEI